MLRAHLSINDQHKRLPGQTAWLICEQRSPGDRRYYLCSYPENASRRQLVTAIKARWSCEQAHQQLKQEFGLDHFEGRSWNGLHHHALLTMMAFAFTQTLRWEQKKQRSTKTTRTTSNAISTSGETQHHRSLQSSAVSTLQSEYLF